MNILPKKSWHVRTKANIERVRKDEEKAADEEKERQRKIALAEQEARTSILRDRARKRGHDEIEAPPSSSATPAIANDPESEPPSNKLVKRDSKEISLDQRGHINFFKDIEEGLVREGKNKEHEAEKAAEKEKWEKQIGLLTYLGQSSIESQNDTPWYLHDKVKVKTDEEEKPTKPNVYEVREAERQDRDGKLKNSLDPLRDMRKHLEKHHKHKHGGHKHKERHHKHKKSSKEKKEKAVGSSKAASSSSSSSSQANSKPSKTVEQMRAERLRREASEKQKIAAVMAKARGEIPAANKDDLMSDADKDRSRGYNSKYNPNFVKPLSRNRH